MRLAQKTALLSPRGERDKGRSTRDRVRTYLPHTLPSISTARALYHSFGFVEVAPYCQTQFPARFISLSSFDPPQPAAGQGVG